MEQSLCSGGVCVRSVRPAETHPSCFLAYFSRKCDKCRPSENSPAWSLLSVGEETIVVGTLCAIVKSTVPPFLVGWQGDASRV